MKYHDSPCHTRPQSCSKWCATSGILPKSTAIRRSNPHSHKAFASKRRGELGAPNRAGTTFRRGPRVLPDRAARPGQPTRGTSELTRSQRRFVGPTSRPGAHQRDASKGRATAYHRGTAACSTETTKVEQHAARSQHRSKESRTGTSREAPGRQSTRPDRPIQPQ